MTTCISRGPKAPTNGNSEFVISNASCTQQQQQYNQIIKVYIEWGNHYLEKARFKKTIQNLESDFSDGVLLADLVEAVCNQKVPDINRKPKTPSTMVENIKNCLSLLDRLGVPAEGITAKDLKEGNLKSVLGLFFALSKYKQQQKQKLSSLPPSSCTSATVPIVSNTPLATAEARHLRRQLLQHQNQQLLTEDMKQSRLPSPYYSQHGAPVSSSSTSSSGTQRSNRGPFSGVTALKPSLSANNSRSASPSHSFIPTPRQSGSHGRSSLNEKQLLSVRSSNSSRSSSGNSAYQIPPPATKSSMLDKIKITTSKDKNKPTVGITSTKRQSSSSGVSSAKSERSDSSNSLCNEGKHVSDKKEHAVSAEIIVKPQTKKKVIVKPTENKLTKLSAAKGTNIIKVEDKHENSSLISGDSRNSDVSTSAVSTRSLESSYNTTSVSVAIVTSVSQHDNALLSKEDSKMSEMRNSSSGIPKPMAAVKGTTKPTNSVAPMPVPDKSEKEEQKVSSATEKTEGKNQNENTNNKDETPNEQLANVSHEKQSSVGDEEDATLLNIKPMEPLLRGYKRGMILPHRVTIPANGFYGSRQHLYHNNSGCYQNQMKGASRFDSKKNGADDDDHTTNISSGYLSDGDILQQPYSNKICSDIDVGYMSEGGAQFYDAYTHELRLKRNDISSNISILSKRSFDPRLQTERSTDVLTALSNSPIHKFPGKVNGQGLVGQDEGPTSPPDPTPTCSNMYTELPPSRGRPTGEPSPVVYRVVGTRSHIKKSDSGQQTDMGCSRQNPAPNVWKDGIREFQGPLEPVLEPGRAREQRSPSVGMVNSTSRKTEKRRAASTSSSREELVDVDNYNMERKARADAKTKVKGVPSSFGYIKRSTNTNGKESKTAQVSAVPRTKVKISGGTQTDMKSYSLGSAAATQLSQGIKERLTIAPSDAITRSPSRIQNSKPTRDDHSLSDSAYTDMQVMSSPYSSWFRHGSLYTASLPARTSAAAGTSLTEADSIESLPAQLQHRASLTNARLIPGSAMSSPQATVRISRSNSIRSTKSEKLYPSMFQRSEELDPLYSIPYGVTGSPRRVSQGDPPSPSRHFSQPPPSGSSSSRYNYMMSPTHYAQSYNKNSPYMSYLSKMNSKEDDTHGSSMSLISTASSSLYSSAEEKQAQELRRLRKDLSEAQEKVQTLTSQLSTNAHVVSAFEKSLSNMTQRLQQLTATAEKKDSELMELRRTIEMLRRSGVASDQSGDANPSSRNSPPLSCSPSLARRHTINSTVNSSSPSNNISRQLSADSVSSLASLSSACSLSSGNQRAASLEKNKKKRGWLRSSFSKAFSRSKKNRNGSVSDIEDSRTAHSDMSAPSSPLLNFPHQMNGDAGMGGLQNMKNSHSSNALYDKLNDHISNKMDHNGTDVVEELHKQLREKDLVLTDIRLEALSSAHQLESLKDTVIRMRNEMLNLKQDNERLQKIVTNKSLDSSHSSLTQDGSSGRRSSADINAVCIDTSKETIDSDCKKIVLNIFSGSHGSYHKYIEDKSECSIALIPLHTTTNWEMLDTLVNKAFKDYVERIDHDLSLGLNSGSIWSYHIGEITRYKESEEPELLPYGYLVGDVTSISVCLKGALHDGALDALVFETLVPKLILQRYISLLTEHKRIMLCGPSGTGKSYLANKLAEYVVYKNGKENASELITTYNVDEKSTKDLRQYLTNVTEQCENLAADLPTVIILDNLHHATSLNDIFSGLLGLKSNKSYPYIIGTINQSTCSTTNLQLYHNFRWILCANHMEPVKGFLSRYLRKKLIEAETKTKCRTAQLAKIIDWIPKVQQHLNKFLETHSSSEITIGPKLFMSCPMDVDGSQVWFTDLWNYSLVPYLLDAVRDGLQLYGKRAPWQDPSQFIVQNYPWSRSSSTRVGADTLTRLRPEDVGYETQTESDPLLNMLMTLQEAANYSSNNGSNSIGGSTSDRTADCGPAI